MVPANLASPLHGSQRMCRKHGLRLVKDRTGTGNGPATYELHATIRVAGEFTRLMLTDVVAIIGRMEGQR